MSAMPRHDLIVRRAMREDLPEVERIENASFGDPWSPTSLASELVSDGLRLSLVAEVAGCVRGYVMAWRVADQLHVLNIASDPAFLRQGVASALLLAAGRRARDEGLQEVTLEVRRGNAAALAFYRRFGFATAGVRPGYYADNGEDAIIMTCDLTDLLAGQ